ncbi:MAG TPA: hypothetical protein VK348_02340, partial [Planctomycetota bacterium]|nr:hypothetical protein [Planctomycetota bacterium]
MVQFQVKKIVAVCLLEAAKVTLDQLGQFRMELSNKGREAPKELGSLYGDCRRLRDFLQRCVGAFPEAVDLELETRDQALLVACCRRAVETIDDRLGGDASPQEREWLQKKRQVLWDQAIDLAEKPLVELPLPRLGPASATNVKALNARINNKVNGPGRLAPPTGFYTGMPPQPNATVPPPDSAQVPGLLTSGGQPQQTWEQHQHQQQLQQQQPSPPARPQSAPQPASPAAPNDLAAGTSGSDAEFVHRDGDEVFDSRPSEL